MREQMVENRADVSERLAGARARGDDEILAGRPEPDRFHLVAIERIALENVGNRRVHQA